MATILAKFPEVFTNQLGHCTKVKARLQFQDGAQPKFLKARPVPYALAGKIEHQLQRLESLGVLEKITYSPCASPIVPVLKPNGQVRVCGDFSIAVNPFLNVDQYPLPKATDILAKLAGGHEFSKIDFADDYLQVELEEDSKEWVVINTHKGLYRFNRLAFGLASAPAIFQKVMDQVISGLDGVCVYLDDLIVTGRDRQSHLENLNAVCQRISQFGFTVKQEKCSFLQSEIQYLGYVITKDGVLPSREKCKAILQ